jgi:hypothetical protein
MSPAHCRWRLSPRSPRGSRTSAVLVSRQQEACGAIAVDQRIEKRFGTSKEGLPINVQLVGSWLAEPTILHLASLLET